MNDRVSKPEDHPINSSFVRASIVILTFARDETLKQTLARLKDKIGPGDDTEIILVDNNPDDLNRAEFLQDFPLTQVIKTGSNKGVWARNYGAAAARGEVIVLLDDDVLVETSDFLRPFHRAFAEHPEVGLVTIKKLDGKTMTQLPECVPHPQKDIDLTKPFLTFRFTGGLIAIRRAMYQQVGGFSQDIFFGHEEHEYAFRVIKAGWKILYSPDVVAVETNAAGGRRSHYDERRDVLCNRYVLDYLHMGAAPMIIDMTLFTIALFIMERGKLDVLGAIANFRAWLGKPGRAARQPIDRRTKAYILACGGKTWR